MFRRLVAVLALTVLVSGCSEPPTKERDQADLALADARKAEAAKYAPDELAAAQNARAKYEDAVAQRDYRQALNFALEARDRGYKAAKQAAEQKAALQKQASSLMAELDALIKTANARLAGGPGVRLTAQAADRLRAALRSAPTTLQEAGTLVAQQDYAGVIKDLTPVIAGLKRELTPPDTGRRGRGDQKKMADSAEGVRS